MRNKLIDVLEKIGLSNAETQVYISLLKLGEAKVGEIIKSVDISSSNVHDACDKLTKKGIISFTVKNSIKHYYSIEPENLNILIQKQQEEVEKNRNQLREILPELKEMKKFVQHKQNAEVFIGITGVKSAFKKLFEHEFKDQQYMFFYKYDEANVDIVHKFFSKMDIEDYYKNLPTRGLFSEGYKKYFIQRKGRNNIKSKFTSYPIPSSVNIYGDRTLIISWAENPVAFLIQSKEITLTQKELFEEIWRLS